MSDKKKEEIIPPRVPQTPVSRYGIAPVSATLAEDDKLATAVDRGGKNERERG